MAHGRAPPSPIRRAADCAPKRSAARLRWPRRDRRAHRRHSRSQTPRYVRVPAHQARHHRQTASPTRGKRRRWVAFQRLRVMPSNAFTKGAESNSRDCRYGIDAPSVRQYEGSVRVQFVPSRPSIFARGFSPCHSFLSYFPAVPVHDYGRCRASRRRSLSCRFRTARRCLPKRSCGRSLCPMSPR